MKARFTLFQVLLAGILICGLTLEASAGKIQKQLVTESTIEQVVRRGVLRVGFSTFVPWAMKDKTGKFVGFEIDVASRLARDTGVEVEFIPSKWEGIIPALLTGKFDVVVGGMSIRPDRNLKVNFTIPYDYSGQTICAHRVLAKGFRTVEDFNKPNVTVGARLGSTSVLAIKKHLYRAKIRLFDEEAQAYQELLNGNIYAVVASLPMPAYQAIKYPDKLFAISDPFTRELIGFAVRKGDHDTLNYFNNWIRGVKSEGWLQERHDYWFNTRDWESLIK
jgi:polar amino acid transport system substrate-binding protein